MAQSQSPRLPVKRGVEVYLFVKNAVLGLGLGLGLRLGLVLGLGLGLGLELVSTLMLTLKQNSLTKRYTPTSRFTDNQSPQSERLAGYPYRGGHLVLSGLWCRY